MEAFFESLKDSHKKFASVKKLPLPSKPSLGVVKNDCFHFMPEIIPLEPDRDNAREGMRWRVHALSTIGLTACNHFSK